MHSQQRDNPERGEKPDRGRTNQAHSSNSQATNICTFVVHIEPAQQKYGIRPNILFNRDNFLREGEVRGQEYTKSRPQLVQNELHILIACNRCQNLQLGGFHKKGILDAAKSNTMSSAIPPLKEGGSKGENTWRYSKGNWLGTGNPHRKKNALKKGWNTRGLRVHNRRTWHIAAYEISVLEFPTTVNSGSVEDNTNT